MTEGELEQHFDAPILTARDVHVEYKVYDDRTRSLRSFVARGFRQPEHRRVHAVRGVDIELHAGEALGVIGRNGCGKSTLLRTLAGLVPPTRGCVSARSTPVLLGVSNVLQPELSCRRNIILGLTALGLNRQKATDLVSEIISFAGLNDCVDLPFRTLSSGMRARLQFAVATAVHPDILMIDETLAVGDAEFRTRSEERMAELVAESGGVILVSHSMGLMQSVCTRLLWLDRGQVVAEGQPREVIAKYSSATRG